MERVSVCALHWEGNGSFGGEMCISKVVTSLGLSFSAHRAERRREEYHEETSCYGRFTACGPSAAKWDVQRVDDDDDELELWEEGRRGRLSRLHSLCGGGGGDLLGQREKRRARMSYREFQVNRRDISAPSLASRYTASFLLRANFTNYA